MSKNRISIGKFESLMSRERKTLIPLCEGSEVNIEIRKTLPLESVLEFVEVVAESCVDSEKGEYLPQLYKFLIKREVITRYTNMALPVNLAKQYELIYNTDVYDRVIVHINLAQFEDIIKGIDKKIEFMLQMICSETTNGVAQLITHLDDVTKQSEEMFDSMKLDNGEGALELLDKLSKQITEENVVKVLQDK